MSAQSGTDPRRRQRLQAPAQAENLAPHGSEVFVGQGNQSLILGNRRQHIDETEQLSFERPVVHRQIDRRLGPPATFEQGRGATGGEASQVFTDPKDRRFKAGGDVIHGSRAPEDVMKSGDHLSIHCREAVEYLPCISI